MQGSPVCGRCDWSVTYPYSGAGWLIGCSGVNTKTGRAHSMAHATCLNWQFGRCLQCSMSCYTAVMKTVPLSIRLDKELRSLLLGGARRTPLNQRELLRRTLRLHLREVIEREAAPSHGRLTNVAPWPKGCWLRPIGGWSAPGSALRQPQPPLRGGPPGTIDEALGSLDLEAPGRRRASSRDPGHG